MNIKPNNNVLKRLALTTLIKVGELSKDPELMDKYLDEINAVLGVMIKEDGILHAALFLCGQIIMEEGALDVFDELPDELKSILISSLVSEINSIYKTPQEKRQFINENFDDVEELYEIAKKMYEEKERAEHTLH